jgi:pimeloyl-ACP methyl ester carboxylesterase
MDEDCLYLNVWSPKSGDRRPVVLFIHGGAYLTGAGIKSFYDGSVFARRGVVFVSINYRLSNLGYGPSLSKEPGSPGLMDQAAALRWVIRNIEKFGGDPGQIYLMGQSKGAEASAALMESGLADEHVRGAVAFSGPRNFEKAYNERWRHEMRHEFRPGEPFMGWRHLLLQEGFRFLMPELPAIRESGDGKNRFKVLVTGIAKEFGNDDIFCYEMSFLLEAYDYIDSYYYELHPGTRDHGSELRSIFSEDPYGRRLLNHIVYFIEHGEPKNPYFFGRVRPFRESHEAIHLFPAFTYAERFPDSIDKEGCRELIRPESPRFRRLNFLEKISGYLGGRSKQKDFDPLVSVE